MMRRVKSLFRRQPLPRVARWSERRPLPPPLPADEDEPFDVVLVLEVLAD